MEKVRSSVRLCQEQLETLLESGQTSRLVQRRAGDQLANLRIWLDKLATFSDRHGVALERGLEEPGLGGLLPALQSLRQDVDSSILYAEHELSTEAAAEEGPATTSPTRPKEVDTQKHQKDRENSVLHSLDRARDDIRRLNKALHRLQDRLYNAHAAIEAVPGYSVGPLVRSMTSKGSDEDSRARETRSRIKQQRERTDMAWLKQRCEAVCDDRNRRLLNMLEWEAARRNISVKIANTATGIKQGQQAVSNSTLAIDDFGNVLERTELMLSNLEPRVLKTHASSFRCPFCPRLFKKEQVQGSWQEHVMTHLRPFVCLFHVCDAGQATFGTYHAWTTHMFEMHASICRFLCPMKDCVDDFDGCEPLADHFTGAHDLTRKRGELLFAANRRARRLLPLESCDVCTESLTSEQQFTKQLKRQEELLQHIAKHMRWYAAVSILPLEMPELDIVDSVKTGTMSSDSSSAEALSTQLEAAIKNWPGGVASPVMSEQATLTMEPEELDGWTRAVTPLLIRADALQGPYQRLSLEPSR